MNNGPSTGPLSTHWYRPDLNRPAGLGRDVVLDCGWGRVAFGQTFTEQDKLHAVLRGEESGRRDICIYPRDPHVLIAQYPTELFVDPSHTYRLDLGGYQPAADQHPAIVRRLRDERDVQRQNEIYATTGMLRAEPELVLANAGGRAMHYLVAEDPVTGEILGTVTGIDHVEAFGDSEGGTSLWCLAVDPQSRLTGIGVQLTRALVEHYRAEGRAYVDLTVLYDNRKAISLYEGLGFVRVPVLSVKRKNVINESLFVGPASEDYQRLNPYARIIADEARRRGITVEVQDAEWGEMRLSLGGRSIVTRESLSELTTAVAMSRCDDKRITRRILARAGLSVPRGQSATFGNEDHDLLREVGELVVKPARGEQGRGITVGVTDGEELERAITLAREHCPDVLLEERVDGQDLRLIVIGHQVVAASIRRAATVIGDGSSSIGELITGLSARRAAATGGESHVPLDDATLDAVRAQGYGLDDLLPSGSALAVRRTSNLHTGGTIHDVTGMLHPELTAAAVRASRALDIPVTGLDMLVPELESPLHVILEANERPGLANHEPQPTAQRFVDLLFPETAAPGSPR